WGSWPAAPRGQQGAQLAQSYVDSSEQMEQLLRSSNYEIRRLLTEREERDADHRARIESLQARQHELEQQIAAQTEILSAAPVRLDSSLTAIAEAARVAEAGRGDDYTTLRSQLVTTFNEWLDDNQKEAAKATQEVRDELNRLADEGQEFVESMQSLEDQ